MTAHFQSFLETLYPEFLQSVPVSLTSAYGKKAWRPDPSYNAPETPQTPEEILQTISSLPSPHRFPEKKKPIVVILAGGQGSRMNSQFKQKVLAPIQGCPAIQRTMETFRSFGLDRFVIIVGAGYSHVVNCLGVNNPNITYLFQEAQMGTGHAGRLAARFLRYMDYPDDVIVTMGDKFLTHAGLQVVLAHHDKHHPDLTLTSAAKEAWPDSGRVLTDEANRVYAIIEKPDIVQKQLVYDFLHWVSDPVPCHAFQEHALRLWNRPKKLKKILGESFWDLLEEKENVSKQEAIKHLKDPEPVFTIHEEWNLTAAEVEEQCDLVNISLYLFKNQAYYASTEKLQANNAQGELYLTDAVHDLVTHENQRHYTVSCVRTPNDYDVMGFNTLEELEQIEQRLQQPIAK